MRLKCTKQGCSLQFHFYIRKHCIQCHIIWNNIASNIQSVQVDYERLRVRSPAGIWSGMTGTAGKPAS